MARKKRVDAKSAPRQKSNAEGVPSGVKQPVLQTDRLSSGPVKRGLAVVGIGASAGGLDAFTQFFTAMPDDTDLAFVLIQHLDPRHVSLTAELLGKHTRMRVVQATDEMHVEPNHVYVIPPKQYLTISGETLHLTEQVENRGVRVPIDFFFRSLADDQQQRAIGIVLSGTGSDGTLGVREIKAAGGMVIVQAPETAQYDGMPRSAIAAGVVDYVLPVEAMPDVLVRYARHWYINGAVAPPPKVQKAPDSLTTIIGLLRARVKYDFSCYKKGTLERRIQRRMGLKHLQETGEYIDVLRRDKDEVTALYKDLLIGVTNFFREPAAWSVLEKLVVAPLVAGGREDASLFPPVQQAEPASRESDSTRTIRVWVPGCATGEEPYSMAMLLTEELQRAATSCQLNVFASDIDQDALAFARAGNYPESIAADVTPERLRRFFLKGEHTYRINKDTRDTVIFAVQNVISDPPFSKLDLVSCRNLLIYLEPDVQRKILAMFHFALRDGGYLFLGKAESISQQHDLFETVSREWRIYRRIPSLRHGLVMPATSSVQVRTAPERLPAVARPRMDRLPSAAQQAIMQRFAPACAVVNRKLEVRYLHGPVDQYLQLPSGELTHDLIAMARQGLRTKLRSGILRAIQDDKAVTLDEVRVRRGEEYVPVRVTIEPLLQLEELADLLLVAFDEATVEQRIRLVYVEPSVPERPETPESVAEYQTVVRHLERELAETRDDLRTSIEEFQTTNEEFKAAHEEVTSINEELQSTNEELETSKEELQSLNEELHTVNHQLESKVAELATTNNDLHNLLASIDHATLFLDRQFRIKRFTPATTQLLRIIGTDIGRPFADFAKQFTDDDMLVDAERVLQQLTPIDKEVQGEASRWYVRRIVPYRTEDDRIDGVVITFTEVTHLKRAEANLKSLNESLEQQVRERTQLLQMVHEITAVANQARTVEEALRYAVERICQYNGWRGGHVYTRTEDGGGDLLAASISYAAEEPAGQHFQHVPYETRYRASDAGVICDVFRTASLRWIDDVTTSETDVGGRGLPASVRAAFAFPVSVDHRVEAVLGFYSDQPMERDERLVEAMYNVGIQLGHVLQRKEAERQIAELTLAERQRLGRELHDSVGQQLSGLGMLVAALRDELSRRRVRGLS